jgi:hypothetical protein
MVLLNIKMNKATALINIEFGELVISEIKIRETVVLFHIEMVDFVIV